MTRVKNNFYLFTQSLRGDAREESKALTLAASADYFSRIGKKAEEVRYQESGKPVFSSMAHHLSVTHAGSFFAAVFAPFPIGIDAEEENLPYREKIAEKYFDSEEKKEPFSRIWTAKEAVSKIGGEGISALKKISVRENFAFYAGKKFRIEYQTIGKHLIAIAWQE